MLVRSIVSLACGMIVATGSASAQDSPLDIRLENGTEREAETRAAIERIVREHDISPWIYTRDVVIDENSIPHSHPVLTLHTRHLGDDNALLAVLLHEQLHWYVADRPEAEAAAIEAFQEMHPDAPHGRPLGGYDQYSTYLHLIVCDLEYQATASLIGDEAARKTLGANTHYEWIYDQVLNNPAIREINVEHGFDAVGNPR